MTTHQPLDAERDTSESDGYTGDEHVDVGDTGDEHVDVAVPCTDDDALIEDAPADDAASDDPAERDETPSDAVTPPSSNGRRRLRIVGSLTVGAVVVGLGTAAVVFHAQHRHTQQVADQRAAVLTAASDGTKAVLSYGSATVDADLARATQFLTGDFRDYYRKLGSDAVAPNAKTRGLTSQARVAGASTTSVEDGSAGALVFVNQSVTPAAGAASTTSTAIRVHLTRVDGRWLIDRFEPI